MLGLLTILMLMAQPAGPQAGQPASRADEDRAGARRSTQGLGDTGPLSRDLGRDSRTPDSNGFTGVYELPRRRGQPRRFARIDGGLIAVFPYSTYEESEYGTAATVPPGTTYYIGPGWINRLMNATHADAAPGLLASPTAIDLGVNGAGMNRVDSSVRAGAEDPAVTPRSIWTDESFRRERLASLLARL